MDKQSYIDNVRMLVARYEQADRWKLWWLGIVGDRRRIWRLRARQAEVLVRELRRLEPPAEDAGELETHLLAPMEHQARMMTAAAEVGPRRWLFNQEVRDPVAFGEQRELMDFCESYGITEPAEWNVHATFGERVREAGLGPLDLRDPPRPLDAERRRKVTRFVRGRRIGRSLDACPDPSWGLFFGASVFGQWACCVVTQENPETPVEAHLAKALHRRWRRRTMLVTVHGDAQPDGMFVIEFPDGSVVASKTPARYAPWPPKPPGKLGWSHR